LVGRLTSAFSGQGSSAVGFCASEGHERRLAAGLRPAGRGAFCLDASQARDYACAERLIAETRQVQDEVE
jgi:hypothetical protein